MSCANEELDAVRDELKERLRRRMLVVTASVEWQMRESERGVLADYDRVACALCAVRDSMVAKIRADGRETLRRLCDAASLELQMPCLLYHPVEERDVSGVHLGSLTRGSTIHELPEEMLSLVLSQLSMEDATRARRVSKYWSRLICSSFPISTWQVGRNSATLVLRQVASRLGGSKTDESTETKLDSPACMVTVGAGEHFNFHLRFQHDKYNNLDVYMMPRNAIDVGLTWTCTLCGYTKTFDRTGRKLTKMSIKSTGWGMSPFCVLDLATLPRDELTVSLTFAIGIHDSID